ncbi:MAG: hydantoinase/oxoprolinase family protein [Desulfurococcales archaeon]|nr:hydantoinase/oxoprolinase family protein [Desulfurococcales archaeon]
MYRVGVDVGGTFTDIVFLNEETSELGIMKVPTTPREPAKGILAGLRMAVGPLVKIDLLIHATTIGTNMFLGQIGIEPPRAALITNAGFEDVIEIGRQNRPSLYDPNFSKPKPLIPRKRRYGVRGRITSEGRVIEELDVEEVRKAASRECSEGTRVFVVSFLHSYRNPSHEEQAAEAIRDECPTAYVVTGSRVDPAPMEYERTSTAVVNGLLKPVLSSYLEDLVSRLRREGFEGKLLIMQSSGGIVEVGEAVERPAAFIESGPSAGAVAVAYFSRLAGIEYSIGFDMGGTTAKASSIVRGEPEIVESYEVGGKVHMGRVIRGSGYPVRFPHIDLAEVSAGGGTIAWVDPGGGLRIGPKSAGADPGPACYGRGGAEPTVTDANLVLGRLPETISGGIRLRRDLAWRAIRDMIAKPLGVTVVEAAWMIIGLANTVMGRAVRLVTLERGHDPRLFTLFAFGGAGPLHAAELAAEVGVSRVLVPPRPGVFSALGLLVADYKVERHASIAKRAGDISDDELERVLARLEAEAVRTLQDWGVEPGSIVTRRLVDAKYWGQAYTLRVPYQGSVERTLEEFHRVHAARYGFSVEEEDVEIVLVRVEAIGLTRKPLLRAPKQAGDPLKGEREVFFQGGWHNAAVYDYNAMAEGYRVEGPAVIEAPDSTILVPPGYHGIVTELGALELER